jgi:hypothetical protein
MNGLAGFFGTFVCIGIYNLFHERLGGIILEVQDIEFDYHRPPPPPNFQEDKHGL